MMAMPELGEEVIGENRDVLDTLAKRRQRDREHIQTIEQILAQRLVADGLARIAVHRRDESNVDNRVLLLAADATQNTVLNDAQQLRLQRKRHLGEFVEEECSTIRDFEQPDLFAIGARERTLAVAKHLGLEEMLRHARRSSRGTSF